MVKNVIKSKSIVKMNESEDVQIIIKGVKKRDETEFHPIKSPLSYIFWKKVEISRNQRENRKNPSEK